MSAVYSIFTSPHHPPMPDHLPTLIVTPHGRPAHILYTYLHTNVNKENYLLTPSDGGDLCVAKLFPPSNAAGSSSRSSSHSHSNGAGGPSNPSAVKCEASRNLKWSITQSGIQNPIYKLTLPPSPDAPQTEQPLFQVSKPNPNAGWWTLFYFTYAGHLIPPKRVEFGRIQKNTPESGGGTRVAITGKTDEEKAVWKTLGEGNEDMVEWIVLCAALTVLDDEIVAAAEKAGLGLAAGPVGAKVRPSPSPQPMQLHQPPQQQQLPPPPQPIRQNTVPTTNFNPLAQVNIPPPHSQPPSSLGSGSGSGSRPQPTSPPRRGTAPPPSTTVSSSSSQLPSPSLQRPPPQQLPPPGGYQHQQDSRSRSRSPAPPPPPSPGGARGGGGGGGGWDPRMGGPPPNQPLGYGPSSTYGGAGGGGGLPPGAGARGPPPPPQHQYQPPPSGSDPRDPRYYQFQASLRQQGPPPLAAGGGGGGGGGVQYLPPSQSRAAAYQGGGGGGPPSGLQPAGGGGTQSRQPISYKPGFPSAFGMGGGGGQQSPQQQQQQQQQQHGGKLVRRS
ncbi:hypothetical protein T439DRAFT_379191 [Meredithblackwellia eburnea MCA 4105]